MNPVSHKAYFDWRKDQRRQLRINLALPALATLDGAKFAITIVNFSVQGAMIETAVSILEAARLSISCGTVSTMARVVWRGPDRRYGLRFERPLTEREVKEQTARSTAIGSYRKGRPISESHSILRAEKD